MDKWRKFDGEELPQAAYDFMKKKLLPHNNQRWQWVEAHFRGPDPEKAVDWIIVTDDGGYYKVGALYSVWNPKGMMCVWSNRHLRKVVAEMRRGETPSFDPGYQTRSHARTSGGRPRGPNIREAGSPAPAPPDGRSGFMLYEALRKP